MTMRKALLFPVLILAGAFLVEGRGQDTFKTAEDAYDAGLAGLKKKDWAKAEAALVEATKLSKNPALTGQAYRALLRAVAHDADPTKYLAAMDHVLKNPTSPAEKALSRVDLLAFLQERNKAKEAAAYYDARLKKDNRDMAALYALSAIHGDLLGDAARAAELTNQLTRITAQGGDKLDGPATARLAAMQVRAGKLAEAADLFERAGGLDERNRGLHFKDAATTWLKAGEKAHAVTAAKEATKAGLPEGQPKLNQHFWHRGLGQVYLQTAEYQRAIPHLEKAIELTDLDGYKKGTQAELDEARKKASP